HARARSFGLSVLETCGQPDPGPECATGPAEISQRGPVQVRGIGRKINRRNSPVDKDGPKGKNSLCQSLFSYFLSFSPTHGTVHAASWRTAPLSPATRGTQRHRSTARVVATRHNA